MCMYVAKFFTEQEGELESFNLPQAGVCQQRFQFKATSHIDLAGYKDRSMDPPNKGYFCDKLFVGGCASSFLKG